MPKSSFYFRPSARLQQFLGKELLADPNVAILEFVKNAYDAGASRVVIEFQLAERPTSLVIADDGVGMNESSFEANWMHPGFSEKAELKPRRSGKSSDAAGRLASRTPVGEKGIGRLAAGRLGDRLDVFTRTARNQPWLHVEFNWNDFANMNEALDAVPVVYDFETAPPEIAMDSGTIVVISELSMRWEQMVRGRPVRGRRRTRLGRLRQDLEFLVRPLAAKDFSIELRSDMVQDPEDVGEITPHAALENADYSYTFRFSRNREREIVVEREIRRSREAAELTGKPRQERLHSGVLTPKEIAEEGRPDVLECGPFEGTFAYNPPPAERRAKEIDESPVGVLLYRDGVLVEPYGVGENDWLGVRARKAQRQGHAAIQPDTFTGTVLISRRVNTKLRDQSNRLGLLVNPESESFLAHVRAEFGYFERLVYGELLTVRWEQKRTEKAGERATETQERARIFIRALAHSLRQPLSGLDWTMLALEQVEQNPALPAELAQSLSEIRGRGQGHLDVAAGLIRKFLDFAVPEFETVNLGLLVSEAVNQVSPLADQMDVTIHVERLPDREALVPDQFIVQALADLLTNAIEAPRANDRPSSVTVLGNEADGDLVVSIQDNGAGIVGATADTALASIESTKGRPAVGLKGAEMSIAAARGRLVLAATGKDGTRIDVVLPTKLRGVRRNGHGRGER